VTYNEEVIFFVLWDFCLALRVVFPSHRDREYLSLRLKGSSEVFQLNKIMIYHVEGVGISLLTGSSITHGWRRYARSK
jgi:hypothetical protein